MLLSLGRSLVRRAAQQQVVASGGAWGSLRRMGGGHGHDDHDDDHHDPTYDSVPTVFDKLVKLTVVDIGGKSHAVQGLVGQTLSEALIAAGFPASYFFPNLGFYTQHVVDAHVFIPKDYWPLIPNFAEGTDEADAIKRTFRDIVQDHARETSYLASYVTLKPEMNNMTLGIGPIKPWHLHPYRCFSGVHEDPTTQFSKQTNDIFG